MTGEDLATSVPQRLEQALEAYLNDSANDDVGSISVDAIAQLAGVSRATAYRYLGSKEELVRRATMMIAQEHFTRCEALLETTTTVAQRVEEMHAYTARETAKDNRLMTLLVSPREGGMDTAFREMSSALMLNAIQAGQLDGQVRDDISTHELMDWMHQQGTILNSMGLDEDQTRQWVRRFLMPVLDPPGNVDGRLRSQVRALLDDVQARLQEVNVSIATGRYTFRA